MTSLEERIARGKRAVVLARDRGLETSQWEAELGKLEALVQAKEVAQRTKELLATQGWCLWKCTTLGGDIIAVVRDELVEGVPKGYPVYIEAELKELFKDDLSEATLRLVHEAKKLAGAKVTTRVTSDEGGNLVQKTNEL